MSVTAEKIAAALGGRRTLGRQVRSMPELEAVIMDGIPRCALDDLIGSLVSFLDRADIAVQLRNKIVPRATYQRTERLNLQVSETTERIARLYALAQSVFEDQQAATRFLLTPHPELNSRAPFDVALTEIGGRQVEEVIERGLHGLPA